MTESRRSQELRYEIDSVRDRVRDIEWRFVHCDPYGPERDAMMNERQRALDKLRKTKEELLNLGLSDIGVDPPADNGDPNYGGTK